MNTFTAKKLGEVLAFATAGNETIENNESLFREAMGVEMTAHIIEMNDIHAKNILHLADVHQIREAVEAKKEKTTDKLRAMRDLYIGEKKNDASEMFEWLSFFEGAAYGHWSLIKGIAESADDEMLVELADDGTAFHFELLNHIASELGDIGKDTTEN